MLIQSSLHNSIEAALYLVSDHGKQDFLYDWMPGAETWQTFSNCDVLPQDACEASLIREREKSNDLCSLNQTSELLAVGIMPESSAPNFVYQRRKRQKSSADIFSAQASANTDATGGCLSALSSEAHTVNVKDKLKESRLDHVTEALRVPVMPVFMCNVDPSVAKSECIDGCFVGKQNGFDEGPKSKIHRICEFNSINDSCSSSKSNMERGSASLKTEIDDTGECSSSGALVMGASNEDLSEKDLCISILRSEGLLERFWPISTHVSSEAASVSCVGICSRSCNVCGHPEIAQNMLICDHCEEAFHVSCCNPRLKKMPVDEWFCHSCLKKKCKIIMETATRKSLNVGCESGRSQNATSKSELGSIAFMLRDTEPYATGVRVGKAFQAEVPDWSGPITDEADCLSGSLELDPSDCFCLHNCNSNKSSRVSSIGNWLQCREVINGVGEGADGTICGKWRRAPLFEVQTDNWECFRSILWDPIHADCAVPQELDTDQVLKQLKYVEMLRPRFTAKRQKVGCTKADGSQCHTKDEKHGNSLLSG